MSRSRKFPSKKFGNDKKAKKLANKSLRRFAKKIVILNVLNEDQIEDELIIAPMQRETSDTWSFPSDGGTVLVFHDKKYSRK